MKFRWNSKEFQVVDMWIYSDYLHSIYTEPPFYKVKFSLERFSELQNNQPPPKVIKSLAFNRCLLDWRNPSALYRISKEHLAVLFPDLDSEMVEEAECSECWGTGYVMGFGAPCPRGCKKSSQV